MVTEYYFFFENMDFRRCSFSGFSFWGVPVSYIFLAFYRFYLSPGVRTSSTPGQVLKKSKRNNEIRTRGPARRRCARRRCVPRVLIS